MTRDFKSPVSKVTQNTQDIIQLDAIGTRQRCKLTSIGLGLVSPHSSCRKAASENRKFCRFYAAVYPDSLLLAAVNEPPSCPNKFISQNFVDIICN